MVLKRRRIETDEAKALRSKRQHFAAPGGQHDRLVGFLARALPMAVGVLAALMVITPLSPRREISFLLDRNSVAVIKERLRVDNALYRGQDDTGRPFALQAGEAVQRSSAEGVVRMTDMEARILLEEGPARIDAPGGAYDIEDQVMRVPGAMQLATADGYTMLLRGVDVDLASKQVTGAGGVSGTTPTGTFSANRLEADLEARTVALAGNARLRMMQGRILR